MENFYNNLQISLKFIQNKISVTALLDREPVFEFIALFICCIHLFNKTLYKTNSANNIQFPIKYLYSPLLLPGTIIKKTFR